MDETALPSPQVALTREGGHSHPRIVHALGDATGRELMRAVIEKYPSLGGNYVVTPAHLRNEQTLYFSGTVEESSKSEPQS